jgi:hypothetical protein
VAIFVRRLNKGTNCRYKGSSDFSKDDEEEVAKFVRRLNKGTNGRYKR